MKQKRKLAVLLTFILILGLTGCMGEYTEKRVLVKEVKRKADDTFWGKTTYEYDKYGRKIKELATEDGEVIRKHTWEYDEQGNVVNEYELDLRMGRVEIRTIKKFDDKGRKIEHKTINKTGSTPDYEHDKYKYNNDQDKVIEKISYNKNGDIIWREIYEYNQNKKKTLAKSIDKDGEVYKVEKWRYNDIGKETYYVKIVEGQEKEKIIREFDENGNEVLYKEYEDGKIEHHYKYTLNENGNKVKKVSRDNNGEIDWIGYCKYDDSGNKVEEKRVYKKKNLTSIQRWKYDENGNRLKYWGTENGELDFEWIYEYDKDGNLIYHEKRNGEGEVKEWEAYEWYKNGQKKMSNTPIIPSGRSVLKYDKEGNLIESKDLSEKTGEAKYWEEYYYNDNNKKIKEVWGRKGKTNGYIKYKYENIKIYKQGG